MSKLLVPLAIGAIVGFAVTTSLELLPSDEPERTSESRSETDDRESVDSAPTEPNVGESSEASVPNPDATGGPLARLALIEEPKARREAALALVDPLGNDLREIERIAGSLPAADRVNFTLDAISERALASPQAAIALALMLQHTAAQSEAIERIATLLVSLNPQAALAHKNLFENYDLADLYVSTVFEEWARLDPSGFLSFVEQASPDEIASNGDAFVIAAQADPGRLLSLSDAIPRAALPAAQEAALDALVRQDPSLAFAYIDSLAAGDARDRLLRSAARSYALRDVEGAVTWLHSQQSPEIAATNGLLDVLADVDPIRGTGILISSIKRSGGIASFESAIAAFTPGSRDELSLVANQLSEADDAAVQVAFSRFIRDWSYSDPEAAFQWAVTNPTRLNSESVVYLGRNLGANRPDLAAQVTDRLPPEMRDLWIDAMTGQ